MYGYDGSDTCVTIDALMTNSEAIKAIVAEMSDSDYAEFVKVLQSGGAVDNPEKTLFEDIVGWSDE